MYSNAATRGKMGFTPPSPISVGKPPATKSEAITSSGYLPSAGASKACPLLPMGLFFKGRQWESKGIITLKILIYNILQNN